MKALIDNQHLTTRRKLTAAGVAALAAAGLVLGVTSPASAGIVLWSDATYSGTSLDVGTGTSYVGGTFNDQTRSFKVPSGHYAILYQERDYGGVYTGTFYSGWSDLRSVGYAMYNNSSGIPSMDKRTSSVG